MSCKHPITRDATKPMDWHGRVTEFMVRQHFKDRGLEALLGEVKFFKENDVHYLEFGYNQPKRLEDRGVDWLDTPESDDNIVFAGHGTYWECMPRIAASGTFMVSDNDKRYGAHEYHKAKGVYVTPQFDAWSTHYSWPCNVFGNRCFYGIGFLRGKSQEDDIIIKKQKNRRVSTVVILFLRRNVKLCIF